MKIVLVMVVAAYSFAANATGLEGSWISDCYTKVTENGKFYIIESLKIDNGLFQRNVLSHEDRLCRNPFIDKVFIGEYRSPDNESKYRFLDLFSDSVVLKPKTDMYVEYFNNINFCGFDDWTLEGKEVLNETCFGQLIGSAHYDIFEMGTRVVYLGDQFDKPGTTPEFRPTRINRVRALHQR